MPNTFLYIFKINLTLILLVQFLHQIMFKEIFVDLKILRPLISMRVATRSHIDIILAMYIWWRSFHIFKYLFKLLKKSTIKIKWRWFRQSGGNNFHSSLDYRKGMLKLRTSLTILCYSCPIIRPRDIFPGSLINHWFYSKDMTDLQKSRRLVIRVMRDVGCRVEKLSNPVTTVRSNDR